MLDYVRIINFLLLLITIIARILLIIISLVLFKSSPRDLVIHQRTKLEYCNFRILSDPALYTQHHVILSTVTCLVVVCPPANLA